MTTIPAGATVAQGPTVLGRLERLSGWPLPWTHLAILAAGYLFAFLELAAGGLATRRVTARFELTTTESLLVLVAAALLGYAVGSVVLGHLADRAGRIPILALAMGIGALGSLAGALSNGPQLLAGGRFLTGVGVGAIVNLTSTYLAEVAPAAGRGRVSGIVFLTGILGQSLATLLAPASLGAGWRWLFAAGVLLAVTGLLARGVLPESPRWLVQHGQVEKAVELVDRLETSARARGATLAPPESVDLEEERTAFSVDALRQPPYASRLGLLAALWFLWSLGTYGFLANAPALFSGGGYGQAAAIAFAVAGAAGLPVGAAVATVIADRFQRRVHLLVAGAVWLVAMALLAPRTAALLAVAGFFLASAGIGLFLQLAYTCTAESFPTRARSTGFGLADGVGHLGGALGALGLPVLIAATSFPFGLVAMGVTAFAAGVLALSAPRGTGRRLEDVSG